MSVRKNNYFILLIYWYKLAMDILMKTLIHYRQERYGTFNIISWHVLNLMLDLSIHVYFMPIKLVKSICYENVQLWMLPPWKSNDIHCLTDFSNTR